MGYAVLLYFDNDTEQSIWDLNNALIEHGISSKLDKSGHRPHISLAGFSTVDQDRLLALVQECWHVSSRHTYNLSANPAWPAWPVSWLSPRRHCLETFVRSSGMVWSRFAAPASAGNRCHSRPSAAPI